MVNDTNQASETELDSWIEKTEELLSEGNMEEVESRLDEAFTTFGEHPRLLDLQAELSLEAEEYDEAFAVAEKALKNVEDGALRAKLLVHQGYAKYYLDELDAARQLFNQAVRKAPQTWNAIVGRAIVHEHLGFLQAAMLDLDRAIEMDSEEAQPFAIRGSVRLRLGQANEAQADFSHAVELDHEDEESRLQLARLQALAQQSAEAIETLEPLVEQGEDPDFVFPAALLRSQLSLTLGSTDAAGEDAQKAIDLEPEQPWGYLQLAACHLTAMDAGKTLEVLKQAESFVDDPLDVPDLFALRASAYEQLDKMEKAAQLRQEIEGAARLPSIVYGELLNPAQNIPLNPNKPIDIRALLTDLFGSPKEAPEGYEKALRNIIDQIPQIIAQNPGAGQLQIELPYVEGMEGPPRSLVLQVNQNTTKNA